MTSTAIQVSNPQQLMGTLAVMIGFHPEDSLVVAGLSGARRRLGPVARVDLQDMNAAGLRALGSALAPHVDGVIAVIYGGRGEVTEADLRRHLALRVDDVLWAPNSHREVHAPVAEAAALRGRAVLRDRAALRASVEHRAGTGTEQTRRTVHQATAGIAARDRFLIDRMDDAPVAVAELIAAAQSTTDTEPGTAHLCAALAMLAYRAGDGALGQVAVARALRIDPGHSLAQLAEQIMAAGLHPGELAAVVRDHALTDIDAQETHLI